MPAAPPTDHEELRLATLAAQNILDTGHDDRFHNIVQLACDIFSVPTAVIALVDRDRQWFKAAVGVQALETPRDEAFCAHAILRPHEVLLVEDAAADPRFADNPLVLGGPKIRFYAGAPFCAANGEPLGTLCLIDTVPRSLTPLECARLQGLSRNVAAMVDLHRSAVALDRAATHDRLTQLANKVMFKRRLDAAIQGAMCGRPCAVLRANLDGFRHINDRLGQDFGDGLLVAVGRRLSNAVRGIDLVARIGGDEFAILLEGPVDDGTAALVADRITEQMRPPFHIRGESLAVSVSIGSAFCPLDATDRRGLMRIAGAAMDAAKLGGTRIATIAGNGNTDDNAPQRVAAGRAMEAGLRQAMVNGGLSLHFQPFFSTASGAVKGFEALLRWLPPMQDPIAPSVFLPLAEATGLIAQLDCWVLRSACRAAASWPGNYTIAVNLSAHWFSVGGAVERVRQALREFNLAPERLEVELTERTVVSSRDIARGQMAALRDMGVHIAMDDFGTGYSSLAYLRQLPFDKVKLDRAFIAPLGEDRKADSVARAVIQLGQALDMQVCGEGVETLAQLAFLRREGCDFAQGYLLGRPKATPCTDSFPVGSAMPPSPRGKLLPAILSAARKENIIPMRELAGNA